MPFATQTVSSCVEEQIRALQSNILGAFACFEKEGWFYAMDVEEFRTELELVPNYVERPEGVEDDVYQATIVLASKRIGLAFHDLSRSALGGVESDVLISRVSQALQSSVHLEMREVERLANQR